MGAIMPILYEGAVPVFCDVDRDSCLVTAETIAACVTERTRAVIVTHLFGTPCDMEPILELAKRHGLFIIEGLRAAPLAKTRSARSARSGRSVASASSRASI